MLIAALILFELGFFAVLVLVFKRLMAQNVVSATQHLEELNQAYSEKEREADRRLQDAQEQAREIVEKSRGEAEKLKVEILAHAETERESIVTQARAHADEIVEQADKSRQQLLAELDERIGREAVAKATQLLEETLPEEFKRLVHAQWAEELIAGEFLQLERIRIPAQLNEVRIVSAFELSAAQRKAISKKLEGVFKREVTLREETDPSVVAGLIIHIGDVVLDGSLKNRIKERARS